MSAPGDILVRKVDGGWIVSTGIEADGWFVTTRERVVERISALMGVKPAPEPDNIAAAVRDLRAGVDTLVLLASREAARA